MEKYNLRVSLYVALLRTRICSSLKGKLEEPRQNCKTALNIEGHIGLKRHICGNYYIQRDRRETESIMVSH
jgi:hypothetical protein